MLIPRRELSPRPGRAAVDHCGFAADGAEPPLPAATAGWLLQPQRLGGRLPRSEAPRSSAGDASCARAMTNPRVGETAEPRRAGDGTAVPGDRHTGGCSYTNRGCLVSGDTSQPQQRLVLNRFKRQKCQKTPNPLFYSPLANVGTLAHLPPCSGGDDTDGTPGVPPANGPGS